MIDVNPTLLRSWTYLLRNILRAVQARNITCQMISSISTIYSWYFIVYRTCKIQCSTHPPLLIHRHRWPWVAGITRPINNWRQSLKWYFCVQMLFISVCVKMHCMDVCTLKNFPSWMYLRLPCTTRLYGNNENCHRLSRKLYTWLCFALLCCSNVIGYYWIQVSYLTIYSRIVLLPLRQWQSYVCPGWCRAPG